MKIIKFFFSFIFLNLIIFEIFSLSMCTFLDLCSKPNYSLKKWDIKHWVNHETYGVWHKEQSDFVHQSDCFSVKYFFNNFGAKDKVREVDGKNRSLIIGDSYVEGYGVDNEKIFSYLLENESKNNIQYLNFSTSGYFGSTQYFILISDLLEKIEFDRVILFLNPSSDFKDDSIEYGKIFHSKKYRPYFDSNTNQIFYYNEDYHTPTDENLKFKDILDNYTYSYKFLRYLKNQLLSFIKSKKINQLNNRTDRDYISYYEKYPEDSFLILKNNLFNINQMLLEKNIKFIVFTIPSKKDIEYFNGYKKAKNNLDLVLKNYLNELGIKFSGILDTKNKQSKLDNQHYLDCTDHFNEIGHQTLKDIVINKLSIMNEKF